MLLAEDNHVIETISTYGSDKPLSVGILLGRLRCCEHLVDADAAHAGHVLGRSIFRKCLDDLLGGPSCAGMLGDVEMKNAATVVCEDEEYIQNVEGRGWLQAGR